MTSDTANMPKEQREASNVSSEVSELQGSVHDLFFFLKGLFDAGKSGFLSIDTGMGIKKIYIRLGRVIFASSELMDDRLGEVIYRRGLITLDELTNSAVQVDRNNKFGQVLLKSRIFSNIDLWNALCMQVREIYSSLFIVDSIKFQWLPGFKAPPTEVGFAGNSHDLLHQNYARGQAFRDFMSSLQSESTIQVEGQHPHVKKAEKGSFLGDVVSLIEQNKTVSSFVNSSKLHERNSLLFLFDLRHRGMVQITPQGSSSLSNLPARIKAGCDAYSLMVEQVVKSFDEQKVAFPLTELRYFAQTSDFQTGVPFDLTERGQLSHASIEMMRSLCSLTPDLVDKMATRIDVLSQFVLQIAGDYLNSEVAKKIRGGYQELLS